MKVELTLVPSHSGVHVIIIKSLAAIQLVLKQVSFLDLKLKLGIFLILLNYIHNK